MWYLPDCARPVSATVGALIEDVSHSIADIRLVRVYGDQRGISVRWPNCDAAPCRAAITAFEKSIRAVAARINRVRVVRIKCERREIRRTPASSVTNTLECCAVIRFCIDVCVSRINRY